MKPIRAVILMAVTASFLMLSGCLNGDRVTQALTEPSGFGREPEPVTILVAAAASLKYSFDDELIPMFQETYPYITVDVTYDSSGKLKTQIEEGLSADIFMSAAMTQMDALAEENLIDKDSITKLLENKIVLIVHEDFKGQMAVFEDVIHADMIAIGDPQSVPAGQYAREAFESLGIWEQVQPKASFGTNVTEVLQWVKEGSADAGIVYATDAAAADRVTVVDAAPADSLADPVVYPVGIVSTSRHKEAASLFLDFLQSDEAMAVFQSYGFSRNSK